MQDTKSKLLDESYMPLSLFSLDDVTSSAFIVRLPEYSIRFPKTYIGVHATLKKSEGHWMNQLLYENSEFAHRKSSIKSFRYVDNKFLFNLATGLNDGTLILLSTDTSWDHGMQARLQKKMINIDCLRSPKHVFNGISEVWLEIDHGNLVNLFLFKPVSKPRSQKLETDIIIPITVTLCIQHAMKSSVGNVRIKNTSVVGRQPNREWGSVSRWADGTLSKPLLLSSNILIHNQDETGKLRFVFRFSECAKQCNWLQKNFLTIAIN